MFFSLLTNMKYNTHIELRTFALLTLSIGFFLKRLRANLKNDAFLFTDRKKSIVTDDRVNLS